MNLDGKVAVITGGASGIGYAIAKNFLEHGAKVVIADWNEDVVSIAQELGNSDSIFGMRTDVSKEEDVKALFDKTVEVFGQVNIVIANAGVGSYLVGHEETMEEWNRVIGINLTGVFLTDKYAICHMLEQGQGGAILNMASILGFVGSPNAFAYSSAKGGVINMTKTLSITYAKNNIRVNAIAPGYVDTPILTGMTDEMRVMLEGAHPIGRLGRPEEIASMVNALVSDEASFVTGVTLPVDGGYLAQ